MLYDTLQNAMQTNLKPVVLSVTEYKHMGCKRNQIKARKARGKNVYQVIQYENGSYSEAVAQ